MKTIRTTNRRRGYCRRSEPARNRVLVGDAAKVLGRIEAESVDCVVTSPPYHLLRRYDAGPSEIGNEVSVDEYVSRLREVMREIARVLKPTGALWLNLGDSYSRHQRYGATTKCLLMAPERLLAVLVTDGWLLRNKVVWTKPNPMPNSVKDRLNCTWEIVYFLVRQPDYYFDLDAIRQPHASTRRRIRNPSDGKYGGVRPAWAGPLAGSQSGLAKAQAEGRSGHPLGKNPGDAWRIATAGYRGQHRAVFPEELVRRPILATCPERVCPACGAPWTRERRRDRLGDLVAACDCGASHRPGLVLDPFFGSGTVGVVAERHGRQWLGIELNRSSASEARQRIRSARRSPHR